MKHGLDVGTHSLCRACRRPLAEDDLSHAYFEEGVSCHHCHGERTEDQRARYRERHRQAVLAEARGVGHIGRKEEDG